jgi:hypothetical protein
LEVEPAEGRRRIQIRGFIGTERLLPFLQKDSRALADIPNGQSLLFVDATSIRHMSRQRADKSS